MTLRNRAASHRTRQALAAPADKVAAMTKRSPTLRFCAAWLSLAWVAASASDTGPAQASPDLLAGVRSDIAAGRFTAALTELRRIDDTGSADWHNLMGLTLRMLPHPDLQAAQAEYEAALRIEPRHRGALEYSGELKLQQGDVAGARQRLQALAVVCARSCEEYHKLEQAIAHYEATRQAPSGW